VNWRALFGPTTIPPGCPGPNCGWRFPITVHVLASSTYDRAGNMRTRNTGRLCRCPICGTLYVELADKVQRCGSAPSDAPAAKPKDVLPTERPRNYPAVDEDMARGYATREPR